MAKNKKLIIYHSTKLALLTILAVVIFILNGVFDESFV